MAIIKELFQGWCSLASPWESGSAQCPSLQQAGADQEVKAELIGRQEPTCWIACNRDPSVPGGDLRGQDLCLGGRLRTSFPGTWGSGHLSLEPGQLLLALPPIAAWVGATKLLWSCAAFEPGLIVVKVREAL